MKVLKLIIEFISKVLQLVLLAPVFFYKCCLSPLLPKMCRFQPTCSTFMVEAIKKKGPIWGLILGVYRILRCNPFNPGGYDPVERWPPYWTGKKWVWKIPKNIEEKLDEAEVKFSEELLAKHGHAHQKLEEISGKNKVEKEKPEIIEKTSKTGNTDDFGVKNNDY